MDEPPRSSPDIGDPGVSLVVVAFNSAAVLPGMLEALSVAGRAFRELIFVDNASSDQTRELVARRLPAARTLANDSNRGFAAAVNQGVAASGSEFVLLANPDTLWTAADLAALVGFLQSHPRAAAVCPRLVFPDGAPQASARRFPTHSNIWFSRHSPLRAWRGDPASRLAYTLPDPEQPQPVEAVAATFMLLRRDAFQAVGGMDEGYFLYVEDTDLCKRWRDAGYEVWLNPLVAVRHDWQGGSRRDRQLRAWHRDGMRRYFRKHHPECRVGNLFLSGALSLLNLWDRLTALRMGRRVP